MDLMDCGVFLWSHSTVPYLSCFILELRSRRPSDGFILISCVPFIIRGFNAPIWRWMHSTSPRFDDLSSMALATHAGKILGPCCSYSPLSLLFQREVILIPDSEIVFQFIRIMIMMNCYLHQNIVSKLEQCDQCSEILSPHSHHDNDELIMIMMNCYLHQNIVSKLEQCDQCSEILSPHSPTSKSSTWLKAQSQLCTLYLQVWNKSVHNIFFY